MPAVGDNAAFGLIFIAGFCSGVHCIGTLLLYETNIKSMIFTVCGGLVLLMGIQMWGIIPGLRRITMSIGSAYLLPERIRKKSMGKPFITGFLTGFMPCGMLSVM